MEQEELKRKIEEIKEKTSQVFNEENQKKAVHFVDGFLGWMYKASYFFIALMIGLFSLILVGSVFYAIFHGPSSDIVPIYKEVKNTGTNHSATKSKVDKTSIEINKKFGDELIKICELACSKDEKITTDDIVQYIRQWDKKYWKTFVNGMLDFLEDAKADLKDDFIGSYYFQRYVEIFTQKISDLPNRKKVAEEECKMAWGIALIALYSILISLILPLLIQIQKNTRKE